MISMRDQAEHIVYDVQVRGRLRGLRGSCLVDIPMSLAHLATYGVPDNLDLEYDSNALRTLVQELAQIAID